MTINGSLEDGYTGEMSVMGESVSIAQFVLDDRNASFSVNAEGVSVRFEIFFEDDSGFSGVFEGAAPDGSIMGGSIIGTKR